MFGIRHSVGSVASRLARGLEEGSIVLRPEDPGTPSPRPSALGTLRTGTGAIFLLVGLSAALAGLILAIAQRAPQAGG